MLLRICLIIAILAGAGVIAVSHFQVRPRVQEVIDAREKNAKDRDTEKSAKLKAQKQLKDTQEELAGTKSTLSQTQTQLAETKRQADSETKRANDFKGRYEKTFQDLNEIQQKLARWDGIGLDPSQVKELILTETNERKHIAVLKDEMSILVKNIQRLTNMIAALTTSETETPLPAGLRGKVVVVDPKWSFVVLDIGEKQGAAPNGVLMVSRNSKLVAKVKIMSVLPERCIANIIPGWKLGEVMEGDQVLY